MIELLSKIIDCGGIFCGGFVRDYLIRGEQFNDIDFFFFGEWPHPFSAWPLIRSEHGRETAEYHADGIKFHCVRLEPIDLTCNLFCFDGQKIFPRKCFNPIDYKKAWEMLLNKQFIQQVPAIKNIALKTKLLKRRWEFHGISMATKTIANPNISGPWSDFTLAAERFHALTRS